MDSVQRGQSVWVQLHKSQPKIAGTILDYAFSPNGDYLQCMVELELPNPLVAGQVLRQIYPQPIQSYKLSKRQEPGTQVIADAPVAAKEGTAHTVYTLGYGIEAVERHAARSQLITFLKQPTPGIILDVRFSPYSKIAGWNIEDLQQEFSTRYVHMAALGNKHHHTGGPIELVDEESGLQQAQAWLAQFDICLLCGCYRVDRCHRSYIAERLAERTGVPLCHLLQPHQDQDMAGETQKARRMARQPRRSARKNAPTQPGASLWTPEIWTTEQE